MNRDIPLLLPLLDTLLLGRKLAQRKPPLVWDKEAYAGTSRQLAFSGRDIHLGQLATGKSWGKGKIEIIISRRHKCTGHFAGVTLWELFLGYHISFHFSSPRFGYFLLWKPVKS